MIGTKSSNRILLYAQLAQISQKETTEIVELCSFSFTKKNKPNLKYFQFHKFHNLEVIPEQLRTTEQITPKFRNIFRNWKMPYKYFKITI